MITSNGKMIVHEGGSFCLPYKIKDVCQISNQVVVLFDPDEQLGSGKQFKNLRGYGLTGQEKWVAELPTNKPMDAYYKIASSEPLIVYSVCSYECEIDAGSGKILKKIFYK